MSDVNRIVVTGNLTRDPELKYTPQGVAVATFGIAVNRFTKNDQGENEVDFFNIVAWRRSAEFAGNYLKKGRKISVDGRLQTRNWVDQATGQKRTAWEIIAENLNGLDRRGEDDGQAGGNEDDGQYAEQAAPRQQAAPQQRAAAPAQRPAQQPAQRLAQQPAAAARPAQRHAAPVNDSIDEQDPFAE